MPQLLYEIKMTGYAIGEDADDAFDNFRNEADMLDLDSESTVTDSVPEGWLNANPYGEDDGKSCKEWAEITKLHDKLVKDRKEWESRQSKMFKGFNE